MRTLLATFFLLLAAPVASQDLAAELKAMNQKSYDVAGTVYSGSGWDNWYFKVDGMDLTLLMDFAVAPKYLREIKDKCILTSRSTTRCAIKGKAEVDTSGKDFVLILYQIDELNHVK